MFAEKTELRPAIADTIYFFLLGPALRTVFPIHGRTADIATRRRRRGRLAIVVRARGFGAQGRGDLQAKADECLASNALQGAFVELVKPETECAATS